MEENKKKILKIVLMILASILIIILVILLMFKFTEHDEKEEIKEQVANEVEGQGEPGKQEDVKYEKQSVKELSLYKLVENSINGYINDIYEENSNEVLDVLSQEYKQKEEIDENNVFDKVVDINTYSDFDIKEIEENNIFGNYVFFVKGKLHAEKDVIFNEQTGQWEWVKANNTSEKELKYIVTIDFANSTYSIEPTELNEYSIPENYEISITENDNNTFEYKVYENYEKIGIYLQDFKEKISNDKIEEAYELLEDNYKKAKFPNIESFRKYINDNKERLEELYATKYKINEYDNYYEYVLIDKNNNYYIINEYSAMNYKIALDTYTNQTEETEKKYNSSSIKEKVGMNINKIFNAINTKDYTYVYNKLDDTFKNNYYKTQQELENYLELNLYEQNEVKFEAFEEREDSTYIYNIIVKDKEDESQTKAMTIVMQLKEGTDYKMSFSIK